MYQVAYRMFGVGLLYGCGLAFLPWACGQVIQLFRRITDPDEERRD